MSPEAVGDRLAVLYGDIQATAMRGAPICNEALAVEAVGFRDFAGYVLGVVVTPWFLNLIAAESQQIGRPAIPSSALRLRFPAGDVDFIVSELRGFGRIASCSLFSPMSGFADQQAARAAAEAALCALFDAHLHEPPAAPQPTPREGLDRRALFGGRRSPPQSGEGAL
jgi:[NiFe] hydrogenase assembly HybE family chaperone